MVMATVVASVLAGHTVRPVLLPEWTPTAAAPTPAAPLTTAEAASLRQLLHAVVTSGSGRVLAPAGVEVAKTGTAEYADGAATKKYTWMVAGRGDLAVAVFVRTGSRVRLGRAGRPLLPPRPGAGCGDAVTSNRPMLQGWSAA